METRIAPPVQAVGTIASVYLRMVILTMFSYNFILTIEDEIMYIWSKPFSFGTIFYAVGRYLAAVSVIYSACKSGFTLLLLQGFSGSCDIPGLPPFTDSTEPCVMLVEVQDSGEYHFPFKIMFYTSAVVAVCAMVLLQLRTYALYSKSRRILVIFCILNVVAIAFFIVQLTVFTGLRNNPRIEEAVFSNKFFGSGTNYSPLFWVPFMLNEMATFSLVAFKFLSFRKDPPVTGSSTNNLARIIVRDNMIYFSVIFLVYLFGLILFANEQLLFSLANTHLLGSVAVSGILAPNLFLSLKKSFYAQKEEEQDIMIVSDFHASAHPGASSAFSYNNL